MFSENEKLCWHNCENGECNTDCDIYQGGDCDTPDEVESIEYIRVPTSEQTINDLRKEIATLKEEHEKNTKMLLDSIATHLLE